MQESSGYRGLYWASSVDYLVLVDSLEDIPDGLHVTKAPPAVEYNRIVHLDYEPPESSSPSPKYLDFVASKLNDPGWYAGPTDKTLSVLYVSSTWIPNPLRPNYTFSNTIKLLLKCFREVYAITPAELCTLSYLADWTPARDPGVSNRIIPEELEREYELEAPNGLYGGVSVDYLVIRTGMQRISFPKDVMAEALLGLNATRTKLVYETILFLDDREVSCEVDERSRSATFREYVASQLKPEWKWGNGKCTRVLCAASTYVPVSLLHVAGPDPNAVKDFFDCFTRVYILDAQGMCNPDHLSKWITRELPDGQKYTFDVINNVPLQLEPDDLPEYIIDMRQSCKLSKNDHVTHFKGLAVSRIKLYWSDSVHEKLESEKCPWCEYEITTSALQTAFVSAYPSMKCPLMRKTLGTIVKCMFRDITESASRGIAPFRFIYTYSKRYNSTVATRSMLACNMKSGWLSCLCKGRLCGYNQS